MASASLSILVTQSAGFQEPSLLETVPRSLILLWSSWGWSWALILSWALLPHKYLPEERAGSTEAPLFGSPAVWAPWQQMHLLQTGLFHRLILSCIAAPALGRWTPRGTATVLANPHFQMSKTGLLVTFRVTLPAGRPWRSFHKFPSCACELSCFRCI